MSSRQLRKLRKQQDILALREEASRDEEESDNEPVLAAKPRASAFAGFAALGSDDDNDGDEDEDEPSGSKAADAALEPVVAAATPAKKSKKPKKKKKAKKPETASPAAGEAKEAETHDGLDEIDLALQELNVARPAVSDAAEQAAEQPKAYSEELSRLLSINTHHLKVLNEMRALFGRDTIEAARVEDDTEAQPSRRRQRQVPQNVDLETFLRGRPGQKISEVLLRRNPFILGKENWPKASASGLTMEAVHGDKDEFEEYRFCHNKTYDDLEGKFFTYVQMHDPMQLVYFLHDNPYHVSTLIQVSKVAKQDQNSALAGDLCERALFTLGRVTLSSFRKRIEQGKARMDFRRPENRQFWLAGYNYIRSLLQKGTYRTALEWTKLYISLAPEDPYGLMNYTHVLAIRAHQAQWLIDLFRSEFFRAWDAPMAAYYRQTLVLAKLQQEDYAGAIADLVRGMQELPWLYAALCSALGIDVPRCVWGVQPRTDDEELYTELYLHTAKDVWNNAQATSFIQEAGAMAHKKPDVDALPAAARVPLGIVRFVYLDNTPSLMGRVPRKMLHATPNFDFDPLPPAQEDNVFSSEVQKLPWGAPDDFWQSMSGPMRRRINLAAQELRMRQQGQMGIGEAGEGPGRDDRDFAGPEFGPGGFEDYEDEGEDEEMQPEEVRGFLQRIFDIFRPLRAPGAQPAAEGDEGFDEGGPWGDDDEDNEEMPPLVPDSDQETR